MTIREKPCQAIRQEFQELVAFLDARRIRLWCATRATADNRQYGRGGVTLVHAATGVSRRRIYAGLQEVAAEVTLPISRIRRPGGGRKPVEDTQPGLRAAVETLIEPCTRGDPESPLRWVSKRTRHLRDVLRNQAYQSSHPTVGRLLDDLGYSLQAPNKTKEGGPHPDRDAQFLYIAHMIRWFQWCGWLTLSVDAKKKENIGEYGNTGREYRPKGQPMPVRVYAFVDRRLGKVTPYGLYDIDRNDSFVNVGISADTAEFAVNSLRKWWDLLGRQHDPYASAWLLTADGGGSKSSRARLWKYELHRRVNETTCAIDVCQ